LASRSAAPAASPVTTAPAESVDEEVVAGGRFEDPFDEEELASRLARSSKDVGELRRYRESARACASS